MAVDPRAPVTAIARGCSIIDVRYEEAFFHQQVMEHILAEIRTPPFVHILQVARTVNEKDRGASLAVIGQLVDPGEDIGAIAGP